MPSYTYSSSQFYKDWRYEIGKDFLKPSGDPFEYAKNGLQHWGEEEFKFVFPQDQNQYSLRAAAISNDGKYIAVGIQHDIGIYDLINLELVHTLQGHLSNIDSIAFRPGSSAELVSTALSHTGNAPKNKSEIIFWDLRTHQKNPLGTPEAISRLSRNAANYVIADLKAMSDNVIVQARDQTSLAEALEQPISQLVLSRGAASNPKLFGRLQSSFQSQIFSPSGKFLIYMPGERPKSNGDDDWEMRIYDIDQRTDAVTIAGNRDAIMWAGFNRDETRFGTACWDGTFRIWDAFTGKQIYRFETERQNWTAAFSPDGKYFAGTSGDDKLHVYDLSDGSEYMTFEGGGHWSRALDWHPSSQQIAFGGDPLGKVFIIDIVTKSSIQHRFLSTAATKLPEERKRGAGSYLTAYRVRFVEGGDKLVIYTSGDGSAEVYDLKQGVKWRFARAGTMNPPDDETEVTSMGGFGMLVYEDKTNNKIRIGSVDVDALRLWSVPMNA